MVEVSIFSIQFFRHVLNFCPKIRTGVPSLFFLSLTQRVPTYSYISASKVSRVVETVERLNRGKRVTLASGDGGERIRCVHRTFVETITGRPMSREKGYRRRQPAYDIDQSVSLDEPVYRLTLIIIAWPTLFNGHATTTLTTITIIPRMSLRYENRSRSALCCLPVFRLILLTMLLWYCICHLLLSRDISRRTTFVYSYNQNFSLLYLQKKLVNCTIHASISVFQKYCGK